MPRRGVGRGGRRAASPPKNSPRVTRSRAASAGVVISNAFATPPKGTKRKNSAASSKSQKRQKQSPDPIPAPPVANHTSPEHTSPAQTSAAAASPAAPSSQSPSAETTPVGLVRRFVSTILSPFSPRRKSSSPRIELPPPIVSLTENVAPVLAPTPTFESSGRSSPSSTPHVSAAESLAAVITSRTSPSPVQPSQPSSPTPLTGPKTTGATFRAPSPQGEDSGDEEMADAPPIESFARSTYALTYSDDESDEESEIDPRYDISKFSQPPPKEPWHEPNTKNWTAQDMARYLRKVHGWDPDALEKAADDIRHNRIPDIAIDTDTLMIQVEYEMKEQAKERVKQFEQMQMEEVRRQLKEFKREAQFEAITHKQQVQEDIRTELYPKALEEARREAMNLVQHEIADFHSSFQRINTLLPFVEQYGIKSASFLEEQIQDWYRYKRGTALPSVNPTTGTSTSVFGLITAPASSPATPEPKANSESKFTSEPKSTSVSWSESLVETSPAQKAAPSNTQPSKPALKAPSTPKSKGSAEPTSAASAPPVPPVAFFPKTPDNAGLTTSQQKSYDKILSQATKYTPKQPSRLREVSRLAASPGGDSSPAGIRPVLALGTLQYDHWPGAFPDPIDLSHILCGTGPPPMPRDTGVSEAILSN